MNTPIIDRIIEDCDRKIAIKAYCDILKETWQEHPNQRFIQLLFNIFEHNYASSNLDELYNVADEDIFEAIKEGNMT